MTSALLKLIDVWIGRRAVADASARLAIGELRPIAVVTGGSEGIGLAFGRRLARAGHDVALIARRTEPLEAAASLIRKETGRDVIALAMDVSQERAPDDIARSLSEQGRYIDILVNNAGIGAAGAFTEADVARLSSLVDLNVRAATSLMRHVLPGMLARGRGGVINVASLGGLVPGPNQAVYYASKAYLISLSEAVAQEVAGRGVRICCVAPGPVRTRFHARMGADDAVYRWTMLPITPSRAAAAGYLGYLLGRRLVVPGVIYKVLALAVKLLPHRLLAPLLALLLRPRR